MGRLRLTWVSLPLIIPPTQSQDLPWLAAKMTKNLPNQKREDGVLN